MLHLAMMNQENPFFYTIILKNYHMIGKLDDERTNSPLDGKVAQDVWTRKYDYYILHIFKFQVQSLTPTNERSNLDAKHKKCILLGTKIE